MKRKQALQEGKRGLKRIIAIMMAVCVTISMGAFNQELVKADEIGALETQESNVGVITENVDPDGTSEEAGANTGDASGDSEGNRLTVFANGEASDYAEVSVEPNGSTELYVTVDASDLTDISYEWKYYDSETEMDVTLESTSNVCRIENVQQPRRYWCTVTDRFGNQAWANYDVKIDNHLQVYANGGEGDHAEVFEAVGGTVDLYVTVSADDKTDLRYEWAYYDSENEINVTLESTSDVCSITIGQASSYWCKVTDRFGNEKCATFDICNRIDNHLQISANGEQSGIAIVFVEPNGSTDLCVTVSGNDVTDLSYQWYNINENGERVYLESTSDKCIIQNVQQNAYYHCEVTDCYGNHAVANFCVRIENHLQVFANGEQSDIAYVFVEPNGSTELCVTVSADDMTGLSYKWYYTNENGENVYLESTSDKCTIQNMQQNAYYYCEVTDGYGNQSRATFDVRIENHLQVNANGEQSGIAFVFVDPNGSTELCVTVSADDLTGLSYKWYYTNENGETVYLESTSDKCTIQNVQQKADYYCEVTDGYGNQSHATFTVIIENHLQVNANGEQSWLANVFVEPNGSTELYVTVSAVDVTGLSYKWYYANENGENVYLESTSDKCTIQNVQQKANYYCEVTDGYGSQSRATFAVRIENHLQVKVNGQQSGWAEVSVDPNGSTELYVTVSADDMTGLNYKWYYVNENFEQVYLESTSDKCTIQNVKQQAYYHCEVTDCYGNQAVATAYVRIDNHLQVNVNGEQSGWAEVSVEPNGSTELYVTVSADDMTGLNYKWYYINENRERVYLESTSDKCTIQNVQQKAYYYCDVMDSYGNTKTAQFNIKVNNQLKVMANGYSNIFVTPTGRTELNVTVSARDKENLNYQWYYYEKGYYNRVLLDSTSDKCVIENAPKSAYYYCEVTDRFGNQAYATFNVIVNHLKVYANGTKSSTAFVYTEKDGSVDLYVNVSADDTTRLRYSWECYDSVNHRYIPIYDGSITDTQKILSVKGREQYRCKVEDIYGNCEYAYFYVGIQNHLQVYSNGEPRVAYIYVEKGGMAQLNVAVSADNQENLKYEWYYRDMVTHQPVYLESTSNQCLIDNVQEYRYYICNVTDTYGNEAYGAFYVGVQNNLQVSPKGESVIYIEKGGDVDLSVAVSADDTTDLSYVWYGGDGIYSQRLDCTSDHCTVTNIQNYMQYGCQVTDCYGNYKQVEFIVYVNGDTLTANDSDNQLAEITVKKGDSARLVVHSKDGKEENYKYEWSYLADNTEMLLPGETNEYIVENIQDLTNVFVSVYDPEYGNRYYLKYVINISDDSENPDESEDEHTLTKTEAKAATCKETGNIEYWYCSTCKKYFSDEAATQEITEAATIIEKNSNQHAGETYLKNQSAATETTDGYTGDIYCSDCDQLIEQGTIIPATGTTENPDNLIDSGSCGWSIIWSLDNSGTLRITGTGDLADYNYQHSPWDKYSDTIQQIIIGDSITGIGARAFSGCKNVVEISIPDSVTKIGESAFWGCPIEQIYIHKNVNDIGDCAFSGENTTSIIVAEENEYYDSRDNCNAIIETAINKLIVGCNNTVIVDGIEEIGTEAFARCGEMKTVNIPSTVKSIDRRAFYMSGIEKLDIPHTVESIGDMAFAFNPNLRSVKIPKTIGSISGLFLECTNLEYVFIEDGIHEIGYQSFSGCKNLKSIYIPASVESIPTVTDDYHSSDGTVYYAVTSAPFYDTSTVIYCEVTEPQSGWGKYWNYCSQTEQCEVHFGVSYEDYLSIVGCGAANEHTLTKTEAKAATCKEPGNIEYWYCSTCKKYFSDEAATQEITEEQTIVAKKVHTPELAVEEDKIEPTCTEAGSYNSVVYCKDCGEKLSSEAKEIAKLGHDLTKTEAKAATCKETGNIEYWYCSTCKKYFSDEAATREITEEQTIVAKKVHTPALAVEEEKKEPTCTEAGSYNSVVYCKDCGEKLSSEAKEIAKLSHELTKTEAKAATCKETGNVEYWYCSICKKYFSNEAATMENTADKLVVAKDSGNHVGGTELKNAKAATATETGYSGDIYCKGCGVLLEAGHDIPATGIGEVVTPTPPVNDQVGENQGDMVPVIREETDTVIPTPADETVEDEVSEKTVTTIQKEDGSEKEIVKEKEKNSKGKEVAVTTTTETNSKGELVGVTEKSKIENIATDTTATVTVKKDDKNQVTDATASISKSVSKESNKVSVSASVVAQIKEAAGTDVDITMTVKDDSGKIKFKLKVDTADLTPGKDLYVYQLDTKTGEYTLVNAKTYTVSKTGNVSISMDKKATYELLTEKEAKKLEEQILSTVKVKKDKASVKKGKKTEVALSSGLNMKNVKSISYSSSSKSIASVSKSGSVTAKKAGTVTIKAKVTLKNGKTKTVKMKITVK